ncbi:MAG: hypothetical protein J07HQX50_01814 [Haloquadratum sp. J07HQX50]|nr:MAG: hypothetical protein J07HQX50_01814 [Haloquadratum sp. J07HQX50]
MLIGYRTSNEIHLTTPLLTSGALLDIPPPVVTSHLQSFITTSRGAHLDVMRQSRDFHSVDGIPVKPSVVDTVRKQVSDSRIHRRDNNPLFSTQQLLFLWEVPRGEDVNSGRAESCVEMLNANSDNRPEARNHDVASRASDDAHD